MSEIFQELREKAKKKISVADHMITQTYPLVGDPRILMSTLENVFLACTNSMGAILYHERLFKRVPPFQDSFDSKFNMFQTKVMSRHNIDGKYANMIRDIKDIILQHRKSPIEFSRKDKFVICDGDYKMKVITIENIKKYIKEARDFVDLSISITSKNEEIFK